MAQRVSLCTKKIVQIYKKAENTASTLNFSTCKNCENKQNLNLKLEEIIWLV